MKAPFFLFGFLTMLITVSAFAEVRTEYREYDQKIRSLVPGMELKLPSGLLLEAGSSGGRAWKTLRSTTTTCNLSLASETDVRLQNSLSWYVEEVTETGEMVTVKLGSGTGYSKRSMQLDCPIYATADALRIHGINVPRERPVKVDLIRADETEIYPQRDESATTAI